MTFREHICESFELFANEFMPEFQDAEAEQQEWKTKVLAASRPGWEGSTRRGYAARKLNGSVALEDDPVHHPAFRHVVVAVGTVHDRAVVAE